MISRNTGWIRKTLALGLLFMAAPSLASNDPGTEKRLIQYGPRQRAWMSPDEIAAISRRQHENGKCGGFMDVTERPNKTPLFLRPLHLFEQRNPTQQSQVSTLLPTLSAQKLVDAVTKLSSYRNRYYKSQSGYDAALWIQSQFKAIAAHRSDVTVELFQHSFKQPSVIARIAGTGAPGNPDKAKEIVVIGAHEDSINIGGGSPDSMHAPGADDDASGVATVIETFRALVESGYRPERTLEFMTYAAEEVGLRGSQDIAERYRREGKKVVGVLQLDMTMYVGRAREIAVITDYVDPGLTRFMKILIDTYVGVPRRDSDCGYACSDHASWTEEGFPAALPFEAVGDDYNPKIHTTGDTLQNRLDAAFGLHFAKLATAFAVELASGP